MRESEPSRASAAFGALLAGAICAAIAASDASMAGNAVVTTTTDTTANSTPGDWCFLDYVYVDPDDALADLEPGCPVSVEVQAYGMGGTYDAFVGDQVSGEAFYDIVGIRDGTRFTAEYDLPDELPEALTFFASLDPHSEPYVCSYGSTGASGTKTVDTPAPSSDCTVRFRVADEIDLGGVTFDVSYAFAYGDLPGCKSGVVCSTRIEGARTIYDNEADQLLHVDVESNVGFSAPADVLTCSFRKGSAGNPDPFAEHFVVDVARAESPPPKRLSVDPPQVTVDVDCSGSVTTTTLPIDPVACGLPCSQGEEPSVRDALYLLRASVGSVTCATCICDVDRSGGIDATDSLRVMNRAVGLDAIVRCVTCNAPHPRECPQGS